MTQRASKAKAEGQKVLDDKINLSPQNTGKICVCIHIHTHVCVYIYIYIFKTYTSFISLKFLKFVLHLHIKIEKWEFFFLLFTNQY